MPSPDRQHEPDDPRLKRLAVRRAVARLLDGLMLFLPVSLPFLLLLPEGIAWLFALPMCLLAEGVLIWAAGATPGKFLMGLRVAGKPSAISFETAVRRSVSVWVLGEAMGLGMLSNISMAATYRRFLDEGTTLWDEKCATDVVSTRPIGDGWLW